MIKYYIEYIYYLEYKLLLYIIYEFIQSYNL